MLSKERMDFVTELCQRMVQCPSLSGQEEALAGLVRQTMEKLGYDEIETDRYGNVTGVIRFGRPGKTILLEGHMDHVDPGDLSQWTVDPYGGTVKDGRLYGRGASDMKGSLAAMIAAAAYIKADRQSHLSGTIMVAATVHEECFEGVASQEIGERYNPDYVVIGEASSLDIKRGQRGRAEVVVETYGRSAHSSNPEKGINAVKQMIKLLSRLGQRYTPPTHPILGSGILELTDIISYPYPGASVVPDRCRVTLDRRLLVGETQEDVLGVFREIIEELKTSDPGFKAKVLIATGEARCYTGETIQALRFAPGWLLDDDHPYVTSALAAPKRAGLSPKLSHYSFCTNGSYYAGKAGIPTIGFGASHEHLAHVVDEYVEISQLISACKGYYAICEAMLT
ncbi:MAG: YgeY family selenium metabolism-linked hydrolase [Firmicutes bacterium]|nr:YgeY family selenium metabolism-linked hydrolase [Candidatus Fermentithermobacillaceae bacterium]